MIMLPLPPIARVFALLAAIAALAGVPQAARAAEKAEAGFQSQAPNAILIDADGGGVLYEKNADQLVYPASLTKLMTLDVVFNELAEGNIKFDDEYTVSEHAWRTGGAPSHGSTMFAAIHSKVPVKDLIQGVIVQSANDGCIILAEGIAGSEADFARMMNARAREIGMTKSTFVNPTGLHDPEHKMTARDLAIVARHLIRTYPDMYHYFSQTEFTWNKIRQQNRDPLLSMGIGADGLKTGYTKEAGYGLVGSAVQNGVRLIAVVMGLKTAKDRADEGKRLLEYGFHAFEPKLLFAEGQTVGEAKLFGGARGSVPLISPDRPIRVMMPKNVPEKITARIVYRGPVPAPVNRGKPIGVIKVWRNEQLALEAPLEASESVGVGNTVQRAFDAAVELVIALFRAGVKQL